MSEQVKDDYESHQFFAETIASLVALLKIHGAVRMDRESMQILEKASLKRGQELGSYLTGQTKKLIFMSEEGYIKLMKEDDICRLNPVDQLLLRNILESLN